MRHLVNKKVTQDVNFMGDTVKVKKLSVSEIMKIQQASKEHAEEDQVATLRVLIRLAVEGAADLTDEELDSFPLDELSTLGAEIVKYSGMGGTAEGN